MFQLFWDWGSTQLGLHFSFLWTIGRNVMMLSWCLNIWSWLLQQHRFYMKFHFYKKNSVQIDLIHQKSNKTASKMYKQNTIYPVAERPCSTRSGTRVGYRKIFPFIVVNTHWITMKVGVLSFSNEIFLTPSSMKSIVLHEKYVFIKIHVRQAAGRGYS